MQSYLCRYYGYIFYRRSKTMTLCSAHSFQVDACCFEWFSFWYICLLLIKRLFIVFMFDIIFDDIFLDSLSCLFTFVIDFHIAVNFYRNPTNSTIGAPAASSLNFPITFLSVLSKYIDFLDSRCCRIWLYHSRSVDKHLQLRFHTSGCQCLWIAILLFRHIFV